MEMVLNKLIEYFDQQLRMQRESSIKYTGEEAFFDALDVCKNAQKSYTPPPPVQSVPGKSMEDFKKEFDLILKSTLVIENNQSIYRAVDKAAELCAEYASLKTKELKEALEGALSNLNEIADCTNGRLREMAETAANKITKALNNNQ